jgi:hypothetical protein
VQGDARTKSQRRFEDRGALGRTENGSVTLAWDEQLGRSVALKRHPRAPSSSDRVRTILSVPPHPNVALVRDDVGDDGEHLLVMDYVQGRALESLLEAGESLPPADALQCASDVAAALAHLHGLDPPVAHGDVKPRNIVLTDGPDRRRAVLVDFGLDGASLAADAAAERKLMALLLPRAGVIRRARALPAIALVAALLALMTSVVALRRTPGEHGVGTAAFRRAPATEIDTAVPSIDAAVPATEIAVPTALPSLSAAPALTPIAATAPSQLAAPGRSRLAIYWRNVKPQLNPIDYPALVDVYRLDKGDMPQQQYTNYGALPQFTHLAPVSPGWLFCYAAVDGVIVTIPIERDGKGGWGDPIPTEQDWTHIVGDGEGLVWLYRLDSGALEAIRYKNGFHTHHERYDGVVPAGFDQVVAVDRSRVLLYTSATGRAMVVTAAPDATMAAKEDVSLPAGFANVLYSGNGYLVGLHADGTGTVFRPRGSKFDPVGAIDLGGRKGDSVAAFDRGFVVYSRVGGPAAYVELAGSGAVTAIRSWTVPPLPIIVEVP